jgi:hypothetical protein
MNALQKLTSLFGNQEDFFIKEMIVNEIAVYLVGFNTLIDLNKTTVYVREMAISSPTARDLFISISNQRDVEAEQLIKAILDGKLVVISDNSHNNAIIEPISRNLVRSIDEPKHETPLLASMNAFGEDIDVNVGMIRKRLNTERLHHCQYQVGELEKRKLAMLYIKGRASNALIEQIQSQLQQIHTDINAIDELNRYLGQRKWNLISNLFSTENPIQAIQSLKKNRIVLFLDNHPFALVFPRLLLDMFSSANDHNYPYILAVLLRILRIIGALATIILPALYVALMTVNPEVLRLDFALFIAASRDGIPLSALLETMTMVVLVDLILEAIVRLPKNVGPTITMVGGIILGQAIVEAKLVSNLLVIVITAIVISGSTLIGVQNSLYIRTLKYPIFMLASIYGILGIFTGLTLVGIHLASLTSNGIPYTTFRIDDKGDTT